MLVRFNPETQTVQVLTAGQWVDLPEAQGPGDYACFHAVTSQ